MRIADFVEELAKLCLTLFFFIFAVCVSPVGDVCPTLPADADAGQPVAAVPRPEAGGPGLVPARLHLVGLRVRLVAPGRLELHGGARTGQVRGRLALDHVHQREDDSLEGLIFFAVVCRKVGRKGLCLLALTLSLLSLVYVATAYDLKLALGVFLKFPDLQITRRVE